MKYLNKSFSVGTENSAAYRDNYDRIFGKKPKPEKQPEIERCHECGSWEAQCGAPGPVPGCACARCLRAALEAAELRDRFNYERAEKAERERDEARIDCDRYIEAMQDMRPHAEGCNFRRRGDQVPCSCMTEVERLRGLIAEAEWVSGGYIMGPPSCPWCAYPVKEDGHSPQCPAFSGPGEVRW